MKEKDNKQSVDRRKFLKNLGIGSLTISAAALAGCRPKKNIAGGAVSSLSEIPKDKMTYRTNASTGDKVSLLGYGCMRWPDTTGGTGRNPDAPMDQETINRLVDFAIEHGVNYFDTSPAYCMGRSESATGIALKRHPRNSFYLATKLSNFAPSTWKRDAALAMYHNSFKELQVDYIDYLLLHGVGMGNGMVDFNARYIDNGVLDYLLEERKKGKIRNLGFSYHGDVKVFDYLLSQQDKYKWNFVQIQLNYVDWKHAKETNPRNTDAEYLYNELQKRGIQAVIMEPLLGGRLSNVHDYIAAKFKQKEPERSVASWAFRFAGSLPGVLTVLSGMTYMEHLQDNLRTFTPLDTLSEDELLFLDETAQQLVRYPTIPCNDCKYCMPCPYGLDIPAILLHYNKCINQGNMPSSAEEESYRQARRAFLIGYDRSVPKLRQANHCIDCKQCMEHCPQGINIPRQLQKIDKFVEDLKTGKIV